MQNYGDYWWIPTITDSIAPYIASHLQRKKYRGMDYGIVKPSDDVYNIRNFIKEASQYELFEFVIEDASSKLENEDLKTLFWEAYRYWSKMVEKNA